MIGNGSKRQFRHVAGCPAKLRRKLALLLDTELLACKEACAKVAADRAVVESQRIRLMNTPTAMATAHEIAAAIRRMP